MVVSKADFHVSAHTVIDLTQMREFPYLVIFKRINVLKMEKPRLVHIIVSDSSKGAWAVPTGTDADNVWDLPGHAGTGSIFFFQLEKGVCENCFVR